MNNPVRGANPIRSAHGSRSDRRQIRFDGSSSPLLRYRSPGPTHRALCKRYGKDARVCIPFHDTSYPFKGLCELFQGFRQRFPKELARVFDLLQGVDLRAELDQQGALCHVLVVFFGAKTERPRQTGIEVREAFLDADAEAEVVFPVWEPQGAVVVAAGDNHDLGGFFPIDQGGRLDAHGRPACPWRRGGRPR